MAGEARRELAGMHAATHALGRGWVRAEHVEVEGGEAVLTLPAGSFDGAEIRGAERVGFGVYQARMMTPRAPGSLSAFFLYEGGSDIADELDVEIFNDDSRRVMFTTWIAGKMTHSVTLPLPFDPSDGFHDYTIRWSRGEVSFGVDRVVMKRWRRSIPRNPMYVMSNVWWPVWLEGAALETPQPLRVQEIGAWSEDAPHEVDL